MVCVGCEDRNEMCESFHRPQLRVVEEKPRPPIGTKAFSEAVPRKLLFGGRRIATDECVVEIDLV